MRNESINHWIDSNYRKQKLESFLKGLFLSVTWPLLDKLSTALKTQLIWDKRRLPRNLLYANNNKQTKPLTFFWRCWNVHESWVNSTLGIHRVREKHVVWLQVFDNGFDCVNNLNSTFCFVVPAKWWRLRLDVRWKLRLLKRENFAHPMQRALKSSQYLTVVEKAQLKFYFVKSFLQADFCMPWDIYSL